MSDEYIKKTTIIRYLKRWTNEYKELDFNFEELSKLDIDEQINYLINYFKQKGESNEQIKIRIVKALANGEKNKLWKHSK